MCSGCFWTCKSGRFTAIEPDFEVLWDVTVPGLHSKSELGHPPSLDSTVIPFLNADMHLVLHVCRHRYWGQQAFPC